MKFTNLKQASVLVAVLLIFTGHSAPASMSEDGDVTKYDCTLVFDRYGGAAPTAVLAIEKQGKWASISTNNDYKPEAPRVLGSDRDRFVKFYWEDRQAFAYWSLVIESKLLPSNGAQSGVIEYNDRVFFSCSKQ